MLKTKLLTMIGLATGLACTPNLRRASVETLRRQVIDNERAFAATMTARDFSAFTSFLSSEAIFISGARTLRGSQQVAAAWKRYYDDPTAPFSWQPETVEVLDSGTLALSTGPVFDSGGRLTGTFISIWRLEAPGRWRIIFDKGCKACE
ncbi:MAG TPA: nuclear transport factor 2 family protein [bacterium]|nr:nuclear transport factor 2 family protein [bacterium]HPN35199.1 nuclear transport factor 2 family protein [bacterium]